MTKKNYDIIIIGAGSVGNPAAMFLAIRGLSVLVVESLPSPGQGQNKAAIGGIRATHSNPAKIQLGLKSIDLFANFKERFGIDIGWKTGGYCFPVYDTELEVSLKKLLKTQKSFGLNIDWLSKEQIREVVPGINPDGLIGGTYSPEDGQVCSLKSADAFFKIAREHGAEYAFSEPVEKIETDKSGAHTITTSKNTYSAPIIMNAAGAYAREIGKMTNHDLPVQPDSHEAGISAPVKYFLKPLIVDMRAGTDGKTANFYFGQNSEGQIIFCYTPKNLFYGTNREPMSEFLPTIAKRLIDLIPALKNILVRRTWRGLYPMTPDGSPIVGKLEGAGGILAGVGMCGQGLMLGPGVAECLADIITTGKSGMEQSVLDTLSPYRDFHAQEKETLK